MSNIIILKETLPRVVEARAAAHAAKLQDEEQPLLQSTGKDSAAEPAADSEGAAFPRATSNAACCHSLCRLGTPQNFTAAVHGMRDRWDAHTPRSQILRLLTIQLHSGSAVVSCVQ